MDNEKSKKPENTGQELIAPESLSVTDQVPPPLASQPPSVRANLARLAYGETRQRDNTIPGEVVGQPETSPSPELLDEPQVTYDAQGNIIAAAKEPGENLDKKA